MNYSEQLWKEYAIEPEVMDNWSNICIFLFHLGFEKGRILLNFPREWGERIKEYAKINLNQHQYKKLEVKLTEIKKSCVKSNRDYQPKISWIDNAIRENSKNPFYAVIHNSDRNFEEDHFYPSQEIYEDHPIWKINAPLRIPKNSEIIARIAEPLFKYATEIKFIDPYFDPGKPWFKNAFNKYLKTIYQFQNPFPKVEIHCKYYLKDKDGNLYDSNRWKDICQKIVENIPQGETVKIVRWKRLKEGTKLHERVILSNRGGMGSDYGLDDGQEDTKTNLSLLDEKTIREIWNDYDDESASSEKYERIQVGKEK